jgi:hypothetical protein
VIGGARTLYRERKAYLAGIQVLAGMVQRMEGE